MPVTTPAQRGDLDTAGSADLEGRLDGRAGIVGVHMHRIAAGRSGLAAGSRDRDGVTELVEPHPQLLDTVGVTVGEQVHDLELR